MAEKSNLLIRSGRWTRRGVTLPQFSKVTLAVEKCRCSISESSRGFQFFWAWGRGATNKYDSRAWLFLARSRKRLLDIYLSLHSLKQKRNPCQVDQRAGQVDWLLRRPQENPRALRRQMSEADWIAVRSKRELKRSNFHEFRCRTGTIVCSTVQARVCQVKFNWVNSPVVKLFRESRQWKNVDFEARPAALRGSVVLWDAERRNRNFEAL